MKNTLKLFDNISSVLWFLMDICWMLEWKLAVILTPLVLLAHIIPFVLIRKGDILPYFNSLIWVAMNICWMLPDYQEFLNLTDRHIYLFDSLSKIFASIGFLLILLICNYDFNLLSKFKRFKK